MRPKAQDLSKSYAGETVTPVRKSLLRHTLDPDRGWAERKCREVLDKAQADLAAAETAVDATIANAQTLTAELLEMRERLEAAVARTQALRAADAEAAESQDERARASSS